VNYHPEIHGPDLIETMEVGGRIYTLRPYHPNHGAKTAGHGWVREVAPGRRSEIGAEGVALLDEIARTRTALARELGFP
jgi:hypothetical protein